jgi:protein-L-isoaspartate(D-aspartate) O-methyltransferase
MHKEMANNAILIGLVVKYLHMSDPKTLNDQLINALLDTGTIATGPIEQAFRKVLRHYFLPGKELDTAYSDEAIITSWSDDDKEPNSSSSQPSIMAVMLKYLDLEPGQKVLEIGTGTGYNAALLASITGQASNVYSIDVVPDFVEQALINLAEQGTTGVNIHCADGWEGWPEGAPYDRIIATASSYDIAPAWFEQLKEDGILVFPLEFSPTSHEAVAFKKVGNRMELSDHSWCGFMRMRGNFDTRSVNIAQPLTPITEEIILIEDVPPDPAPHWDNLAFFLSVYVWPRIVNVTFPESDPSNKFIMISDFGYGRQTLLEHKEGWRILNFAEKSDGVLLKSLVNYWYRIGQPTRDKLHLVAYLRSDSDSEVVSTEVFRRRWFNYEVTWS